MGLFNKEKYFCKFCGHEYSSVKRLTGDSCKRHPIGPYKGKHELYEGAIKDKYTCKYCGHQYPSIMSMTGDSCKKHPDGPYKGRHSPAL